jgi:stage V sporulation protein R
MEYDLNLSRIYELVINSNPCYAFLLESNSLVQNQMIVAHVLAHCDFFKNNIRFSNTSRDMVESMAASANRIREYEMIHGQKAVEEFLDAVLAINEHVDPSLLRLDVYAREPGEVEESRSRVSTPYDDLWRLDTEDEEKRQQQQQEEEFLSKKKRVFPPEPEKDIMWFIEEYSSILEPWQRDIMTILRKEMLYFWPQLETKIMNEGWASYWHLRIMRELDLTPDETIEFAKLNASVTQPSRHGINPYHLGLKIFEDIEQRWDQPDEEARKRWGREPGQGRKKIFEVRELESDISFLRNYLTEQLVKDLDLYLYQKVGNEWQIVDKNWEHVRDQIVNVRVNGGFPYIVVKNGDYLQNGELYLLHQYEGLELDVKYVEKTLPYVYQLWGRTVHLETKVEDRPVLFTHDGKKVHRRFL